MKLWGGGMGRAAGDVVAVVRPSRVLPGLMLVMLLGALDHTIMTPVLPAVAADLGGLDLMPAVLTAYLAAATVGSRGTAMTHAPPAR